MAFPIAHPAAILPLRRFCNTPERAALGLCFPALVVGSVVPDVAYAIPIKLWYNEPMDFWSHHFNALFYFSLPVGLLILFGFYALRRPLVRLLPKYQRELFLPLCTQHLPNFFIVLISLFIGAWSHLAWDSFTHAYGWFTLKYNDVLGHRLFDVGHRHIEVCQILWYITSYAGIVWLMLAFKQWQRHADPATAQKAGWSKAIFVASVFFPLEVAHHFIQGARGLTITAFGTMAIVLFMLYTMEDRPKLNPAQTK